MHIHHCLSNIFPKSYKMPELYKSFLDKIPAKDEKNKIVKKLHSIINSPEQLNRLPIELRHSFIQMKAEAFATYQSLYRKERMTVEEETSVYMYTVNSNKANDITPSQTEINVHDRLISALEKIPASTEITYRGMSGEKDVYKNLIHEGDIVYNDRFMSSSLNIEKAQAFSDSQESDRIVFMIAGRSGKNITPYAHNSEFNEAEILFPPDMLFRVTRITIENGIYYVSLKEEKKGLANNEQIKHIYYGTDITPAREKRSLQ